MEECGRETGGRGEELGEGSRGSPKEVKLKGMEVRERGGGGEGGEMETGGGGL